MNTFEHPDTEKDEERTGTRDLNEVYALIELPFDGQRELAEAIWQAAGRPGRKEEVWLDFPKGPKTKDLAGTFINVGSNEKPVFRTLEQFIPIDQWQRQYLQQKWRGHVFCRPEFLAQITPAAVQIIGERYKVNFTEFAWTHANLEPPPKAAAPRSGRARKSAK
ncbi:MAG: hypothetical protein WCF30_05255 [Terracidiphilus sp.]